MPPKKNENPILMHFVCRLDKFTKSQVDGLIKKMKPNLDLKDAERTLNLESIEKVKCLTLSILDSTQCLFDLAQQGRITSSDLNTVEKEFRDNRSNPSWKIQADVEFKVLYNQMDKHNTRLEKNKNTSLFGEQVASYLGFISSGCTVCLHKKVEEICQERQPQASRDQMHADGKDFTQTAQSKETMGFTEGEVQKQSSLDSSAAEDRKASRSLSFSAAAAAPDAVEQYEK
jgi:hypothetical protein